MGVRNYIRQARARRGISQKALAQRAGIPANTLCAVENGTHTPRIDTAIRIARALGAPVEQLFSVDE